MNNVIKSAMDNRLEKRAVFRFSILDESTRPIVIDILNQKGTFGREFPMLDKDSLYNYIYSHVVMTATMAFVEVVKTVC